MRGVLRADLSRGSVGEEEIPSDVAEPPEGGLRAGEVIRKPDKIIDEYYSARGWDGDGMPTGATLAKLGLEDVEQDVAKFRR